MILKRRKRKSLSKTSRKMNKKSTTMIKLKTTKNMINKRIMKKINKKNRKTMMSSKIKMKFKMNKHLNKRVPQLRAEKTKLNIKSKLIMMKLFLPHPLVRENTVEVSSITTKKATEEATEVEANSEEDSDLAVSEVVAVDIKDTETIKKAVLKVKREMNPGNNIILLEELLVVAVEATEEVTEPPDMKVGKDLREKKESLKEIKVKDKRVTTEVDIVEAVVVVVDTEVETSMLHLKVVPTLSSETIKRVLLQEKESSLLEVKKENFSVSLMKKQESTRSPCTTRTEVPNLSTIIIKRDSIMKRTDKMI